MAISLVAVGLFTFSLTGKDETASAATEKSDEIATSTPQRNPLIAVVGEEEMATAGSAGSKNSWPGEIISSEIAQIQPQREGVITNWFVRIGDRVSAGDVLGKISAPPATPELMAMLAETTESLAMAEAGATIADEYATKEQSRLAELGKSIAQPVAGTSNSTPTTVSRMRDMAETMRAGIRSLIEKILDTHILKTTEKTSWRQITSSPNISSPLYGALDQQTRNDYQLALITLVGELKTSPDAPIETAKKYFAVAERLVDLSMTGTDASVDEFRTMVGEDRKEFAEALADYQESLANVADKETEYALMIGEKKTMVEKDRLMAHAAVKANKASYGTVANQIQGGLSIIAPRGGTVSAIYENVGDLVDPTMKIATVAGSDRKNLIVRMQIPSNIPKPSVGETLFVVRPGFPADKREAKITGVGAVLDDSGSYMADAALTKDADWSAGASVRVILPENSATPFVRSSAIGWDKSGAPYVWGVSEAGRVFARKVAIGRTLGNSVEIYEGVKNGDTYVVTASPDIREDMLVNDLPNWADNGNTEPKQKKPMGGMEM